MEFDEARKKIWTPENHFQLIWFEWTYRNPRRVLNACANCVFVKSAWILEVVQGNIAAGVLNIDFLVNFLTVLGWKVWVCGFEWARGFLRKKFIKKNLKNVWKVFDLKTKKYFCWTVKLNQLLSFRTKNLRQIAFYSWNAQRGKLHPLKIYSDQKHHNFLFFEPQIRKKKGLMRASKLFKLCHS